jgi:hypothetical protein
VDASLSLVDTRHYTVSFKFQYKTTKHGEIIQESIMPWTLKIEWRNEQWRGRNMPYDPMTAIARWPGRRVVVLH